MMLNGERKTRTTYTDGRNRLQEGISGDSRSVLSEPQGDPTLGLFLPLVKTKCLHIQEVHLGWSDSHLVTEHRRKSPGGFCGPHKEPASHPSPEPWEPGHHKQQPKGDQAPCPAAGDPDGASHTPRLEVEAVLPGPTTGGHRLLIQRR